MLHTTLLFILRCTELTSSSVKRGLYSVRVLLTLVLLRCENLVCIVKFNHFFTETMLVVGNCVYVVLRCTLHYLVSHFKLCLQLKKVLYRQFIHRDNTNTTWISLVLCQGNNLPVGLACAIGINGFMFGHSQTLMFVINVKRCVLVSRILSSCKII